MPTITDLTNTAWNFNNSIYLSGNNHYYVDIRWNNTTFSSFDFYEADPTSPTSLKKLSWSNGTCEIASGSENPVSVKSYISSVSDFIITGGADVTNSDLIAWLEQNATYLGTFTLSNVFITFNPSIIFPISTWVVPFTFLSNNNSEVFNSMIISLGTGGNYTIGYHSDGSTITVYSSTTGGWNPAYSTIFIVTPPLQVGFDAWLSANAGRFPLNTSTSFQNVSVEDMGDRYIILTVDNERFCIKKELVE